MKRLDKKVVVVTGAAQGIGKGMCEQFLEEGATVVAADINYEKLEDLQKEQYGGNDRYLIQEVDVADAASVSSLFAFTEQQTGRVDILINNAGVNSPKSIEEISEEEWDWVIAINLKGPFLCIKSVIPIMKRQNSGVIINMVSPAGKTGGAKVHSAHYNSSKAGLITLTKSAARELAPYNVRVNGISPGVIATEMIHSMGGEMKEQLLELIPFSRLGSPRDVAKTAVFLASEEADYITGQVIPVNGGMWMFY